MSFKLSDQEVKTKECQTQNNVMIVSESVINDLCIAADRLAVFLNIASVLHILTEDDYITVICDFEDSSAAEVVWRIESVSQCFAQQLHLLSWKVHEASDA